MGEYSESDSKPKALDLICRLGLNPGHCAYRIYMHATCVCIYIDVNVYHLCSLK